MSALTRSAMHLPSVLLIASLLCACGGDNSNNDETNSANSNTDNNTDNSPPLNIPFQAKGGDYGSVFNAWQFPYLLFPAEANSFIANGITYTLTRSDPDGWSITMHGRHTTLNTQYNHFLAQRWRYSTEPGTAGVFEMFGENGSPALRLTYLDNGRVHQQQLADDNQLISEKWYLDNGNEIRIAYDAPELNSELTITNNDGNSALIYYECASAATAILTMTVQELNLDCSSNRME
ncbi:hypothetical protein HUF18_17680 [Thalassolituus sp. ST750PaO-4]|uniref:hypothetical protein n=1 Tax=Thalassolituus sp. ST750PaO-4 TaxID=2742965 RepID=UPI001CE2E24A|nr:hypothetical protein [Thalassolituus sp. ST750PaO-4]MCA6061615.1 hypothetical protein [Thalassolituus sp. ST750PaO-4]